MSFGRLSVSRSGLHRTVEGFGRCRWALGPRCFSTSQRASGRQQIRMLLVGSPGSGKGTLSGRLHEAYPSLTTVSAGDLLREHIRLGDELGKEADAVIKTGGLMPDEAVMKMIGNKVAELDGKDWLLDGFPRTQGQATLLDQSLSASGRPLNLVVNLDVPENVILSRILDRWIHPPSGRVYNTSYNPPKVAGKDDETGEALVQRSDDNEETFRSRLESFNKKTGPMIAHYRLSFDDYRVPDDDEAAAQHALARLDEAVKRASHTSKVFVDIQGRTSAEIWPELQRVMQSRYRL